MKKIGLNEGSDYRSLFDGIPQPMWIFSERDFRILEVNQAATLRYGYTHEEFLKLTILELRPAEEIQKITSYYSSQEIKQSGVNQSGPWRHMLKNGNPIDVEITSYPVMWKGVEARVVICWDVTERIKLEHSLREAEQRFRMIFENTREGIYQSTPEGKFITVNTSLARMMGYASPEEVITTFNNIGREFYVQPQERVRILELVEREGEAVGIESQVYTKQGTVIWIRDHIRAVKDASGTLLYLEGTIENITDRKEALLKLQMHQQFTDMIVRAQSLFIGSQDSRKAFDVLLEDLLSLTKSDYGFIGEVLHRPNGDPYLKTHTITNIAWDEQTRAFYNNNIQEGLVFDNLNTLFGHVLRTGEPMISNAPAEDPRRGGLPKGHPALNAFLGLPFGLDGKLEGMLGLSNRPGGYDEELIAFLEPFTKNISHLLRVAQSERQRKQTEAAMKIQFDELQKTNQELDHFVYSVSHDLRAPLASILGLINVAEVEPDKDAIPGYLQMIRTSVNKLDGFIHDILDYSRNARVELKIEPIDFQVLVREVQSRFSLLPHAGRAKVSVTLNGDVPFCSDLTRVEIIFNNLFSNAIKYQDLYKPETKIDIKLTVTETELTLVLTDNGVGIEEKYLGDIFNMFFRASEKAKGSGLGLYIARETAIKLGGSIRVRSTYGESTSFHLTLPNRYPQPK